MKKKINIIINILIIFFILTSSLYATTKVYDFSIPSDYTLSDSTKIGVFDGFGSLIHQITFDDELTNADPGTNLNNVEDILVDGNLIYVAGARSDAIDIIDISNDILITVTGSILNGGTTLLNDPRALAKSGSYLYVSSRLSNAIEIINISNPTNPVHAASIVDGGTTYLSRTEGLTISGNYLYATSFGDDALEIIDISTPTNPLHVGSLIDTTRLNGATGIAVVGNYAYITAYNNNSVEIIDISNKTSPFFVGEIISGGDILLDGAIDIIIDGNYAFIVSYLSNALEIIDISTPSNPTHVSSITTGGTINIDGASDIEMYNGNLYITSELGNPLTVIHIKDISNPSDHIINGTINITGVTTLGFGSGHVILGSNTDDKVSVYDLFYDTSGPYIIPNNPLVYSGTIDQGTVILDIPENVSYQISKDNGVTWYFLSGSTWTITNTGTTESNSPSEMNPKLPNFNNIPGGTGEFKWKAFLNSTGSILTEIDSVIVFYTSESYNEIIDFETIGGYTVINGTWTRTTTNPYEGLYSLESGNKTNNSSSCFDVNRDIYTESNINFYKEVSSEASYDFLIFYIDGVEQTRWSGEITWSKESYIIGNGNHTFTWCYNKDASISSGSDTAWVDYIEIAEIIPITEVPVLDFEITGGYSVTTTATTPGPDWLRVTTEKYEGAYSLESQNRTASTNSCFERIQDVSSNNTGISFYKKVSSEPGYDYLIFSINGVEQTRWSGEIAWSKESYNLTPATYTLEWCYSKDFSVDTGQDRAWIDLVSVTEDTPIINEVTPVPTPTNDNTPDYTFFSPVSGTISYSGSCNSSIYTGVIAGNNTITFDSLSDGLYTNCSIQVLSSPLNSNILSVNNFTIDTAGINISIDNPIDLSTIANSNFNIEINYSDIISGVNTGSIILNLYKWDGISAYGPDIAPTYIDFTGATINSTGAIYPTSILGEGQYKIKFSIEDNAYNIGITTSIFYVSTGDITGPIVTFNYPFSGALIPNSDFNLDISYSDPETGVDTGSIIGTLKKWDGISSYGPDITPIYVNYTGSVQYSTGAIYPISALGFGKYQMIYSIANNNSVTSTGEIDFYVDEPELIINTGALDIGLLNPGVQNFGPNDFIITIKTVGAGFRLILNKESILTQGTVEITDWNGTNGFGYEVAPYNEIISTIGTDTILTSNSGSINTNGNKNTYIYSVEFGGLINTEQAAGNYQTKIKYTLSLDY